MMIFNMKMFMKKILFFGFIADKNTLDHSFKSESIPQVSAIKFQTSLIQGFVQNNVKVHVLSSLPISSYPFNSLLLIRSVYFELFDKKVTGKLLFSINIQVIKLFIKFINSLIFGFIESRKSTKFDAIIVYSLHSPYLLAAICLKVLIGVPIGVFIPDLPLNMSEKSDVGIRKFLKLIDNWFLKRLLTMVDVSYPITNQIAIDWLPKKLKFLVIEGISPCVNESFDVIASCKETKKTKSNSKRILYTGSFTYIIKFVKWFSSYRELNVNLILIGGGPELFELEKIALSDSRIVIKKFVRDEFLDAEIELCDYLINPRDTEWIGSRYSFPSKLFDYMGRGKPIISTRIAGVPEEYFTCFIGINDDTLNNFKSSLNTALNLEQKELEHRIQLGINLLKIKKSPVEVVSKIISSLSKY